MEGLPLGEINVYFEDKKEQRYISFECKEKKRGVILLCDVEDNIKIIESTPSIIFTGVDRETRIAVNKKICYEIYAALCSFDEEKKMGFVHMFDEFLPYWPMYEWDHQLNRFGVFKKIVTNVISHGGSHMLFYILGRLDHSCDPNCTVSLQGTTLVLTTKKPLKSGQILTIDYVDTFFCSKLDIEYGLDRKSKLEVGFEIECTCVICIAETDAMKTRGKESAFL